MGVTFTYPTGTGLPMISVSNITTPFALQESNFAFVSTGSGQDLLAGRMPYQECGEALGLARAGWCWDIKAGDFDNSGTDELMQATGFLSGDRNRWPELQELAMGNDALLRYPQVWPNFELGDDLSGHEHNPLWVRTPSGRYIDLAPQVGIGAPYQSRGLAFGDVNGDGKLDVLVANQWSDSVLLLNTAPNDRSAADLRLVQPGVAGWSAGRHRRPDRDTCAGRTGQGPAVPGQRACRRVRRRGAHRPAQRCPGTRHDHLAGRLRGAPRRARDPPRPSHRAPAIRWDGAHPMTNSAGQPVKPVDFRVKALRRFAVSITVFNLAGQLVLGFEQSPVTPMLAVVWSYATALLFEWLDSWALRRRPEYAGGFSALVTSCCRPTSPHWPARCCCTATHPSGRTCSP
jgi:hypothetical protein